MRVAMSYATDRRINKMTDTRLLHSASPQRRTLPRRASYVLRSFLSGADTPQKIGLHLVPRLDVSEVVEVIDQSILLSGELKKRGVDLVDVSSGGLWSKQKIGVAQGYQVSGSFWTFHTDEALTA